QGEQPVGGGADAGQLVERDAPSAAAVAGRLLAAGGVNEGVAHGFGGGREEKAAAGGTLLPHQAPGTPPYPRPGREGSDLASPGRASGPPGGAARRRPVAAVARRLAGRLARWRTECVSRRSSKPPNRAEAYLL